MVHLGGQSTLGRAELLSALQLSSIIYFFRKHYGRLRTLGLRLVLLLTSLGRLLIWGPLYLLGWRRPLARLEVIYNWRTILISLWRDDMFDAELLRMG